MQRIIFAFFVAILIHLRATAGEFLKISNVATLKPTLTLTLSDSLANAIADDVLAKAPKILSVSLVVDNVPSVTPLYGEYTLDQNRLSFSPIYDLGHDLEFEIRYIDGTTLLTKRFKTPAPLVSPKKSQVVTAYPLADTVPFNTLFFHVRFGQPMMADRLAYKHVKIYDEVGLERSNPWRQKSFWLDSNRLLVLMVHPGRVKNGITYMGPLFDSGQSYTLTVDSGIRDMNGSPIEKSYSKSYYIKGEDRRTPKASLIIDQLPPANTLQPLTLAFDEGMDHASVIDGTTLVKKGKSIDCSITAADNDYTFKIIPAKPWQKGNYTITLKSSVYDFASNRINRLFEITDLKEMEKDKLDTQFSFSIK